MLAPGLPSRLPELAVGVPAACSIEQGVKGLHVGSINRGAVDRRLLVQVHSVDCLKSVTLWLLVLLAHTMCLKLIGNVASNLSYGIYFCRCLLFNFVALTVEA